jgi:signal transduction histidine kinase
MSMQRHMTLADFIVSDMESILVDWEAFARTLMPAADGMDSSALRDQAEGILRAVAEDLRAAQSSEQQRQKSLGLAPAPLSARETAAQTHAVLRARGGFNIKQLAAEYRALRASVMRLWATKRPLTGENDCTDVIRFNEAIDQALAESLDFFSANMDQSRNLMLGVLGHDMRSPLQAIQMTAEYLAALNAGDKVSQAAGRLITSGGRMKTLLEDLLDFNRLQLGLGMRIERARTDLNVVVKDMVRELAAAYPARQIRFQEHGAKIGAWDVGRMQQLLSNLIVNGLTHGKPDEPVEVMLTGDEQEIRIDVRNQGVAVDPARLSNLIQPLKRGDALGPGVASGLGLGLFIASEVAKRHGGRLDVRSDETGTVFSAYLPNVLPDFMPNVAAA